MIKKLHHIAFEVDDIDDELKAMEKKGFRLIDQEGREGVAGKIGFLHPKSVSGVLVELVQHREEHLRSNEMIKNLHHVGVVVKDFNATLKIYGGMLEAEPVSTMEIPEANLRAAYFKVGGSQLEFFDGTSPAFADFVKANGEGIHHIAYEVENIEGELAKQKDLGIKLVDEVPREIPGMKIAFIGPEGASGVYIELVEPDKG